MTNEEIKEMYKSLANGDDWEYKRKDFGFIKWLPYKLGEEIYPDCEYRKAPIWYVYKCAVPFEFGCTTVCPKKENDIVFKGKKSDCDKWIEDHKLPKKYEYNVYKIYASPDYAGYALIAAETVNEANSMIQAFRDSDKNNEHDSYGYEDVSEGDWIESLKANEKGFITNDIYYKG